MKEFGRWRREARRLAFGDTQLAWWASEEGNDTKPWLLLIHGFPTSSWDWTAVWPALARRFRLAAVDMLGFGLSDKPRDHRYSILEQADIQEALLEHLGVSEAHAFAHDYGDTVAQELLARQIESGLSFALKSVVFLNGGLFPEQHRALPVQKLGLSPLGPLLGFLMTQNSLRRSFDSIFGPETKASPAEIETHWRLLSEQNGHRILHRLLRYIPERIAHRERWIGALGGSRAPLRLINGGADPISGAHLFHYYMQQVPNADAVLLETVGHYPHTEAPEAVLKAFFEFHESISTVSA